MFVCRFKAFVRLKEINITPQKLHSVFDAVTVIRSKHMKIKPSHIGMYKWIRFIETVYIKPNLKNSTLWEVLYFVHRIADQQTGSSDTITFEL